MKLNLPNFVHKGIKYVDKHSPEILTGAGIMLLIGAGIKAVQDTPKALQLIEAEKERKAEEGEDVELTKVETIKTTWKCYIPSVTMAALGTGCLIGSTKISIGRTAAITAAYVLREADFSDYREKVIEKIGKEEEKEIRQEVAKKRIDSEEDTDKKVIFVNNGEDEYCYDLWSNQEFMSNKNKIDDVRNVINDRLIKNHFVSLNEFYAELGIEPSKSGNLLGWNIWRDGRIDIDYDAMFHKGRSWTTIDISPEPQYNYDSCE